IRYAYWKLRTLLELPLGKYMKHLRYSGRNSLSKKPSHSKRTVGAEATYPESARHSLSEASFTEVRWGNYILADSHRRPGHIEKQQPLRQLFLLGKRLSREG